MVTQDHIIRKNHIAIINRNSNTIPPAIISLLRVRRSDDDVILFFRGLLCIPPVFYPWTGVIKREPVCRTEGTPTVCTGKG